MVDYYSLRCLGNFQILEKLNVIGRTSEFARLYGIEFESVLSRGSQVSYMGSQPFGTSHAIPVTVTFSSEDSIVIKCCTHSAVHTYINPFQ